MLPEITTEPSNFAALTHPSCFVCGDRQVNRFGLAINFVAVDTNAVTATFQVEDHHQGYSGLLHGGIASALLDGAMTHCLLQQNIPALTAELTVRYHCPIKVGSVVTIYAELTQRKRGIFVLSGRLVSDDETMVSAKGKFLLPH